MVGLSVKFIKENPEVRFTGSLGDVIQN